MSIAEGEACSCKHHLILVRQQLYLLYSAVPVEAKYELLREVTVPAETKSSSQRGMLELRLLVTGNQELISLTRRSAILEVGGQCGRVLWRGSLHPATTEVFNDREHNGCQSEI